MAENTLIRTTPIDSLPEVDLVALATWDNEGGYIPDEADDEESRAISEQWGLQTRTFFKSK